MSIKSILLICVLATLSNVVFGFVSTSTVTRSSNQLYMRVKTPNAGNIPRKLKRKIRSVEVTTFDQLYTPEFDTFLKVEAQGGIYENIMKLLKRRAQQLKLALKPDFGLKAAVVIPTIVETAVAAGTFQTLLAAVKAAGLVDALSTKDQLTILAPSDEAFAKLPAGKIDELLADLPTLTEILKYHVIPGTFKSKKIALAKDAAPASLNEKKVTIKVSRDGEVTLDGAKIAKADIKCSNGIIHVIDTVLIPK